MIRKLRWAVSFACLALLQPAIADPSLKDVAARTELRAIQSLTLTDQQALTGDKNGKPVTIASKLRFPQGATGKLPVVVLLHGSGGVNGGHEFWAKHFNEMGVASLHHRQLLQPRHRQHLHQPSAARPLQHDRRCLSWT